ncbi:hypothetical protein FRC17_009416 [Serendipita sp. 399]|nr:hypothetical protein FRC17_009416 [Serendipita sp. 399]
MSVKGEEHIYPIDVDYMHIVPEDEKIGLVLKGLHPQTRLESVKKLARSVASVRHCWIHGTGVACVRLEDEANKELIKTHIESLDAYPLPIYDPVRRNWTGKAPEDQPPLTVEPLTVKFDEHTHKDGTVLLLRTALSIPRALVVIFGQYRNHEEDVQIAWTRWYVHGKWIYEYYIKFPTPQLAQKALENHAGEEIAIPSEYLRTRDKVRFPHGKNMHIWLRQTGLFRLPEEGTQETPVHELVVNMNEYVPPKVEGEADEEKA